MRLTKPTEYLYAKLELYRNAGFKTLEKIVSEELHLRESEGRA